MAVFHDATSTRLPLDDARLKCFTGSSSEFLSRAVWIFLCKSKVVVLGCTLTFDPKPWLSCADYSSGFGGRYGVQADRVDKSAMGFDYQAKTEKHESQKGWSGLAAILRPPAR